MDIFRWWIFNIALRVCVHMQRRIIFAMVIQDAVNTEHPRQYSERQGNTKIQFSKSKKPMKIFYFSSQHICLGWKIAKTVWYNFVEDDENFTHFRVLTSVSCSFTFQFFRNQNILLLLKMHESNHKMWHPFDGRGILFKFGCEIWNDILQDIFRNLLNHFVIVCLSVSPELCLPKPPPKVFMLCMPFSAR